ncbi:MAG: glycoside hydrolase family 127 protein [Chloroflexi bacterium]|nr:glycoside hydrolase family 127 protein [Chloroflexota bacterium]
MARTSDGEPRYDDSAIYRQLEATGRIDAWRMDPDRERPRKRSVVTMFFDSDTAKWLEAVGYSLAMHPDPELEALADRVIDMIAEAQLPDGYLNTYFPILEPENRWKNLRDWHEMYNAGHLIEGACRIRRSDRQAQDPRCIAALCRSYRVAVRPA